jgi:hypothetical protein
MPLSPPVAREPSHTRAITINGYYRQDGLYDIEAQLTDTKAYAFANGHRGNLQPGMPLHGMWMRMTIDEDMLIRTCEAVSDATPYAICPTGAESFSTLAGLTIGRGFLRAAAERVGGTHGCTHLRELLQQVGTTAFQTVNSHRAKLMVEAEAVRGISVDAEEAEHQTSERFGGPVGILNTCIAYGTDSPVVEQRWPELYTGVKAAAE